MAPLGGGSAIVHMLVTAGGALRGRPVEAADDIWSLCVILYEMVSGEHPFPGRDGWSSLRV